MKKITRIRCAVPQNKSLNSITLSLVLFLIVFLAVIPDSSARTFYVDPANGNINNVGDYTCPWDTLEQVFRQRKELAEGDSLLLLNGHHGSPVIRGNNADFIVISSYKDHQPTLSRVTFSASSKWKLMNVIISPETAPDYRKATLVTINSSASEIVVENCRGYSVLDNSPWSKSDWVANSCTAVSIQGSNNIIRNCRFLNVRHGILVESDAAHNLIDSNVIENFAADGMRGIGSYNTFQNNTVKNCYDVDDNHDDGFQSYSYGPNGVGKTTVYGNVLRGNTIINFTDPNQKFRGTLQGIGCFDGMYEDWVVENNVVIVNHWNGITFFGALNCKIVNNTLIDQNTLDPGPPWIKITAHKNGAKSSDNIIRNNLTADMANDSNIGQVDHNFTIPFSRYDSYFVNIDEFDLRLKADARAIDRGSELDAPAIDILGTPRPQGDGYDIGAYEYTEASDVNKMDMKAPSSFGLFNYPNPFNSMTLIQYHLPRQNHVELVVYNVRGEQIIKLVDGYQSAGEHRILFHAGQFSSGIYVCKLRACDNERNHFMILQK